MLLQEKTSRRLYRNCRFRMKEKYPYKEMPVGLDEMWFDLFGHTFTECFDLSFLQYDKDRYIESLHIDMAHCEKKNKLLNMAFYLLLIGVTLLLVIKNFK